MVDAAGNGELRNNLGEDEHDHELAGDDDRDSPEHRATARRKRVGIERVDADDRREVGEAKREVGPDAHDAAQLLLVAEPLEIPDVVVGGVAVPGVNVHPSLLVS